MTRKLRHIKRRSGVFGTTVGSLVIVLLLCAAAGPQASSETKPAKKDTLVSSDKDKAEDHAERRGRAVCTMERPENGLPEDLRDHMRLMCDIIALAFQTDKTRIASLLLARDLSSLYYPFLDVREGHHGASHDDLSDGYERISRFHLSQLAYLAGKLDAMPEGEGTVLDNCCLLWLSNMWAGWKHDNMKVRWFWPVAWEGRLKQAGRWTTCTLATITASCAACICPSWTGWE